jgi:hypothetical protein
VGGNVAGGEQNAITDPLRQQVVEREHEMVEDLEARL